jgi:tripeptidyl-peptidase-1
LKPSREGVKAVIDWLKQSEIQQDDIRTNGAWINFVATARQADEMMGANFLAYRSLVDGETTNIRTRQVSLPPEVFKSVKLIHPTTHFAPIKPRKPEIQSLRVDDINEPDASCSKTITPKCLRDLYHIQGVIPDPAKSGFIGVPGFLGEFPAQSDLTQFMKENAAAGEAANYTSSTLLGQENPDNRSLR